MNVPAAESGNMFNLLNLKKGTKKLQAKRIDNIQKKTKPIKLASQVEHDKLQRRLAYNASKYRMNLWKNPVHKHRQADQLVYPLNSVAIENYGSETSKERKQKLQIEQAKSDAPDVCKGVYDSIFKQPHHTTFTEDLRHQKELAMALTKKAETSQKDRARRSYIIQKLVRQNKIKSHNFHRHMKRRQLKEYEKETEALRVSDPAAFSKRLVEAEKLRAKERISLRHKSGSKFAKMKKLRLRYDKESRDAVSAMHDQHKELMAHAGKDAESDASDIDLSSTDDESQSSNESAMDSDSSEDDVTDSRLRAAQWWRKAEEVTKSEPAAPPPTILSAVAIDETLEQKPCADAAEDGDGIYANLKELCVGESAERMEEDFIEEKRQVDEEEAPKDADPFLPGWNSWTGPGTEKADENRRQRMKIRAPKRERKDAKLRKVIIRERVNEGLRKHMVKTIPFPYNTTDQFEEQLKHPIGREWNAESSHRQLVQPRVIIQKGKIIKPLDSSAAFLREKDVERLIKNKKTV